jgi:hypothetical protein
MRDAVWSETGIAPAWQSDPVDVAVSIIDHGLRLLKMDRAAAGRLGLAGFHACAGHPFAAQLWLDAPEARAVGGVFGLEAIAAPPVSDPASPAGAARADCLVRHFPAPATPCWAMLSPDEQAIRLDPGFLACGAPDRTLTRDLFDTPLFAVGLLRLARDPAGQAVAIQALSGTADGLARLRPLLDLLVGLLAFVHRAPPAAAVALHGLDDSHGLHVVMPVGLRPLAGAPAVALSAFEAAAQGAGEPLSSAGWPAVWRDAAAWDAAPDAALCACHAAEAGHAHHHHHDHHNEHHNDHATVGGAA